MNTFITSSIKKHGAAPIIFRCLPAVLALSLFAQVASATPYASGLTNSNGTIKFVLNEDADNVRVIFNNGAGTNDLGVLSNGFHSFSLGAFTNYQIVVAKKAPPGFLTPNGTKHADRVNGVISPECYARHISSASNVLLNFFAPRGLAVNCNPASPYFGRIYVANASFTVANKNQGSTRSSISRGIYLLNADCSDALGLGDTPSPAGLTNVFSKFRFDAPDRITVGEDDQLYICDWYTADGNIYVADPNVTTWNYALSKYNPDTSPAIPVGIDNNHGSISAAYATGSIQSGNLKLYTLDTDLQSDRTAGTKLTSIWEDGPTQLNSLWEYDIGAGPLPCGNSHPNRLWTPGAAEGVTNTPGVIMDIDRGANGYFYITSFRTAPVSCSGLIVRTNASPGAPSAFSSYAASQSMGLKQSQDILYAAVAVAVSPNQQYAAVLRQDGGTWILPLTNGIPDMANRLWLNSFNSQKSARAVKFDAAGNLYVVTDGQQLLRIFSPGGNTVATTGNNAAGTAGTFAVVRN